MKFNRKISFILIIGIFVVGFSLIQLKNSVDHEISTRGFKVNFGGKAVGIVRDKGDIDEVINSIQKELSRSSGSEISIKEEITYEDIHVEDESLTPNKELTQNIKANMTFDVWAYAILVEGKEVGILKSKSLAQEILDKIKEPYIQEMEKENSKIEEVEIVEDIKIEKKQVPLSAVQDFDNVLSILEKGTDEEKIHVVKEGENYWTIANKFKLNVEDLEKANPGKSAKLIHPGDEISLIVPKPYLTVATYEERTYTEGIKFEIKYEESASLYKDQQQVKKKGVEGKREVVAKIEKHNGIEVAKAIIKEAILSQPIAQIVIKGTKTPPPKKGTGSFIMPTRGTLTSRFGTRWSRSHEGIDIGARVGTPIKAADGGTVTFAGWKGDYGYAVDIDHGGGYTTRYAHASKVLVKKGDKVYQDQTIALVGNTGRSTGPHLHFEVRKHGVPQNPSSYIGKKYN